MVEGLKVTIAIEEGKVLGDGTSAEVAIGIEVGRVTRVGRRVKGGDRDRDGKSESGMVEGRKVAIGIEVGRVLRRMGLVEAVEIDEKE